MEKTANETTLTMQLQVLASEIELMLIKLASGLVHSFIWRGSR